MTSFMPTALNSLTSAACANGARSMHDIAMESVEVFLFMSIARVSIS